jgi:hypothetical protein
VSVKLTPVETFTLYDIVSSKLAVSSPSEGEDLAILASKLKSSVMDSLQVHQDEEASAGFEIWKRRTMSKIQSLNDSMKNLEDDSVYKASKMRGRK